MRPPLAVLLLVAGQLLLPAPARAERDEEIALSGLLQQAHDHLDDSWLRRMMTREEGRRFDEEGGVGLFRRHRQRLGVSSLVRCSEALPELETRLPTSFGDLLPPRLYRCELGCQRGAYTIFITLGPADLFVRPAPRPGRIERLFFASPLLVSSPYPAFHRDGASLWLGALWLLALSALLLGSLRLTGRAPGPRIGRREATSMLLWRAGHEVVLVLRLLSVLLVVAIGAPIWWRLGPWPLWGSAVKVLSLLGLLTTAVGLLLFTLGGYFHPRGGASLIGAMASAALALVLLPTLGLCTSTFDLAELVAEERPRVPGPYRLPLQGGTAYVRNGGPLLDLVYLHDGGKSCRGLAPESCRSFGAQVVSPVAGVVLEAVDRYPDQRLGQRDPLHYMGNYVLIQHGRGTARERSLLTHLQRGSVAVRAGQEVRAGDLLGRIGNSGDSDEPHLSLELVSGPRPLPGRRPPPFCGALQGEHATGVPITLTDYHTVGLLGRRLVPRGAPSCGQRVAP